MKIERNGLSGLALRIAVIGLTAFLFGCAPKQLFSDRTVASAPAVEAAVDSHG